MAEVESIAEFIDTSFFSSFEGKEKLSEPLIHLLKIFNVIADGILVTDADDKIILVNRNHQLLTLLSPDQILGRSAFDLTREKIWTKQTEFDVFQLKSDLKPRDYIMALKSGQEVIVTGTPVLDDKGKLSWLVFTSRDVGRMTYLEQKLKKGAMSSPGSDHLSNNRQDELVCASSSMKKIVGVVEKVSQTNSYVFLMGESGVGKDRIARKIHAMSPWRNQPFIHVNCASIPETLFESELFGYEKGSFTGARSEGKMGLMEIADGGTLYLDEITEMTPTMQAKLLQVLQERKFRRLGGTDTIRFNARVISSTNRDSQEIVGGKGFRQDLFYRLCVIPIVIPPLRERKEDIQELIRVFMREYNSKHGQRKKLKRDTISTLLRHPWPGNVRELQHVIERLIIMTDSDIISPKDYFQIGNVIRPIPSKSDDLLKDAVEKVEMDLIRKSLTNNRNTRDAASSLGISQATFLRKAKKYDIELNN